MKTKPKKGFLRMLADNFVIILLAGLIGGLLTYYIDSNTREDRYKSTAKIFVSNEPSEADAAAYNAESDVVLARDCSQVIKNRTIMMQVIVGLDLQLAYSDMKNISAEDLADMVSTCVPENSRIINLTVTDKNPARARGLAEAISTAAVSYLKKEFKVERAEIVSGADMPERAVSKSYVVPVIFGVVCGMVLAVMISAFVFYHDKKIRSKGDVEKYAGIPVLAAIPMHDEIVIRARETETRKTESGENKARSKEE